MGRLSARSNPTGLKEIDRGRVVITVSEVEGRRAFTLDRLSLDGIGLATHLKVVVVACAGNSSIRYEMGTIESFRREPMLLDVLDYSHPLRFRLLIHEAGNPRLLASAEKLRAQDDSQSESLLPMEPADLGERLWKLSIPDDDGPVLLFNSTVFPSAAGAESYLPFGALVLPEALRQIMKTIADDPGKLDDETSPWSAWREWIDKIGVERPPEDSEGKKMDWCNKVADRFCNRFRFASRLRSELIKESGE